jgi:hypothetical protein
MVYDGRDYESRRVCTTQQEGKINVINEEDNALIAEY